MGLIKAEHQPSDSEKSPSIIALKYSHNLVKNNFDSAMAFCNKPKVQR